MLCHFEEIRELWDIKKESGKVPAGWIKGHGLGIPKLPWSCDLVVMEAKYRHFKMTCHLDTYLTLYYNMDFSTLYALPLLVSLPQVFYAYSQLDSNTPQPLSSPTLPQFSPKAPKYFLLVFHSY